MGKIYFQFDILKIAIIILWVCFVRNKLFSRKQQFDRVDLIFICMAGGLDCWKFSDENSDKFLAPFLDLSAKNH